MASLRRGLPPISARGLDASETNLTGNGWLYPALFARVGYRHLFPVRACSADSGYGRKQVPVPLALSSESRRSHRFFGPHKPRESHKSGKRRDSAEKETIRAFISIELPNPVRLLLQEEAFLLRKAGGRASWVHLEHMHLSLRFLGDITEEQKAVFSQNLVEICAGMPALRLAVEGMGAFPNLHRPAVVWAGIRQVAGDLAGLQQDIEQAALNIGLERDNKAFHAHVTLARIRDLAASAGLVQAVRARAEGPLPVFGDEFQAGSVALFRSDLKPGGPVHTRLEEFPLSCKSCL